MTVIERERVRVSPQVERGAALLDEVRPGWDRNVDITKLNLNYCHLCVIGQLYGVDWRGYDQAAHDLGLSSWDDEVRHGFRADVDPGDERIGDQKYAKLTEEWRDLIASRR